MEKQSNNQRFNSESNAFSAKTNGAAILFANNSNLSFNERFTAWLNAYTKPSREKIWHDIEYYRSI